MDESTTIVYENSYKYSYEEPREGYREIDPLIWWNGVKKGLQDIYLKYPTEQIRAIGVTGQMHSTVFLDENGNCVRKAIMWNDLRTADMIPSLKEELSKNEETKYISRIVSCGSPFTNSLWVKENEPEVFKKIQKIMTAYDYIVYKLTGNYSCDYCDASTSSMFDIQTKTWSKIMFDRLGIDESYLGPIYGSDEVVGHTKEGIAVIAGTGDNPATATAMGVLNQSNPVISLGTSGVVILPKKDGDFEGKGKNVLLKANNRIVNVVQGTVQSAGGTHRWWVENIIQTDDMSIDQDKISIEDLGKNKILFYPHISGEKTIYADSSIRGAFFNLSVNTQRKDMTQAVFEGVSFGLKQVLENMNLSSWPNKIQVNGGGSKSSIWMQIMADVLNVEIEVVTGNATPGYGVCLLASRKKQICKEGISYFPNQKQVSLYKEKYVFYKRMYDAIKFIS